MLGNSQSGLETLTKEDLRSSIDNARAEAEAYGTPLFIGEYGIGPNGVNAEKWLQYQAELHDEYYASSALWLWKENSQGSWGLFDKVDDEWQERKTYISWVSRIMAHRIAGELKRLEFSGGVLTLESTDTSSPHLIFIPERFNETVEVTCNEQVIETMRNQNGQVSISCDGILVISPGI